MPPEVGKVKIEGTKGEYIERTDEVVTGSRVRVGFQGKIDGYPLVDTEAEPDYYTWLQVSAGSGGKILHAQGILPSKLTKSALRRIPINDAVKELNESGLVSHTDGDRMDRWPEGKSKNGLRMPKPVIKKREIIKVELAYQVRSTKNGRRYVGPVYVLRLAPDPEGGPSSVTVAAARP